MGAFDVSVITGTFGGAAWVAAAQRAGRTVPGGVPWIHVHGASLHEARNDALAKVTTEWVLGLDADDELSGPEYIEAMASGTADIRGCAVQYVRDGRPRAPGVPRVAGHRHDCVGECLEQGNFLAIGTCVRTQLLRSVGGFEPWALYEDWAAFARCWRAGGSVETIPAAVYRAWVNPQSRNRAPDRAAKDAAHWEIHRAVWPELYEAAA